MSLYSKNVIRGAVTDGEEWVYLVLKLDQRGGGVWMQSGVHRITGDFGKLSEFEVARIPTILVHWVGHFHASKSIQTRLRSSIDTR